MPFKSKATLEAERLAAEQLAGGENPPIESLDNTELKPIATPIPIDEYEPESDAITDYQTSEDHNEPEPITTSVPTKAPVKLLDSKLQRVNQNPRDSVTTLIGRYIKNRYSIDAMMSVISTQLAAALVREVNNTFTLVRSTIDTSKLDINSGPMIHATDVEYGLSCYNINNFFRAHKNRAIYVGDVSSLNDLIGVLESVTMRVMHVVKVIRFDLSLPKMAGGVASLLSAYQGSYLIRGQGSVVFWVSNSSDTFIFSMIDLMSSSAVTSEQILNGDFGEVLNLRN